jgi:hypothetical protein
MATNPPATGARVVSATTERLFETVEALFGRPLTEAERLSFTTRLAGINTTAVAPGDLITADLFNALRADINDLALRLAIVEQGTGLVLSRTEPADAITVGSLLTLVGSGFDPLNAVEPIIVRLGEQTISQFNIGSSAGRLVFTVPDGFAALPRIVAATVQVGPRFSNALQVSLRPRPPAPQAGTVIVARSSTTPILPAPINVGDRLTFIWQVDAQTARPVPFQFDLEISNASGAAASAWESSRTIAPATATIAAGSPQNITTSVTVPAEATAARIAFKATTPDAVTILAPTAIGITIGQAADIPDERFASLIFDLTDGDTAALLANDIVFEGQQIQGVRVQRGGVDTQIAMQLSIPAPIPAGSGAGNYQMEAGFEGAPTGWAVRLSPRALNGVGAPDSRSVTIIITNSEAVGAGTTRMLRVWARHIPTPGSAPDFSTFRRFPVQPIN